MEKEDLRKFKEQVSQELQELLERGKATRAARETPEEAEERREEEKRKEQEQRKRIIAQELNKFSRNERWLIAEEPTTPPEYLKELYYSFGICSLRNPNTPRCIYEDIMIAPDDIVRKRLTDETSLTPPDILVSLTKDPEWIIMVEACNHPNFPVETLKKLLQDKEYEFLFGWLTYAKYLPIEIQRLLLARPEQHIREELAQNDTIAEEVLAKLVDDPKPMVRRNAALNAKTSEEQLKKLAKDPFWGVRANVARRSRTPVPELVQLLNDPEDEEIRYHAALNPNIPREALLERWLIETDTKTKEIIGKAIKEKQGNM